MIGWSLSALVVFSLLSIGLGALAAPRRASAHYGVVLDDPRALAFIRAMGARDAVIGGLLGLMALEHARTALAWGMGLATLIALTDFVVVNADRRGAASDVSRRIDAPRALHAAGAVGLFVTAMTLLAGY